MNKTVEKQTGRSIVKSPYTLKRFVHLAYAALILIFIMQNTNLVETRLFFFSFRLPHAFLLILVLGAGAVLGGLFSHRILHKGEKRSAKPPATSL